MVRRVFGLYLLRSITEELRDLRSLSLYYRLLRSWFSSFSRRYKDKHFSDLSRTGFFELFHLVFGLVFCSLWFLWVWVYWGREKREKEKSAVILRSASFSFCLCLLHCIPSNESFCRTLRVRSLFLPVLYRIQRVLAFRLGPGEVVSSF